MRTTGPKLNCRLNRRGSAAPRWRRTTAIGAIALRKLRRPCGNLPDHRRAIGGIADIQACGISQSPRCIQRITQAIVSAQRFVEWGIRARRNTCEVTSAEAKSAAESRLSRFAIDKAAPRNKSRHSFAHQGRQREAIRLMEWSAVPALRFRRSHVGGSETRPAGHDAGLPGSLAARAADGAKARWRCHEARDRTEPRPQKPRRVPRRSAERRARPLSGCPR